MSIWNKILLVLVIACSLVFFYMSARALKTVKHWSTLAKQYSDKIKQTQDEDKQKLNPEIEQVKAELDKLTVDRQRVWYDCDPKVDINRQNGAVSIKVTIDQPNPSGISNNSMLYAFEKESAPQGRYLGEFKVTAVDGKQITLEPYKMLPDDLKKLASAKRPWNLYDSLPCDSHEIFAQVSDADKKAMLPAESAAEYIDDGKQTRPLRDYSFLFNLYRMQYTHLVDKEQAVKDDNKMAEAALADAKLQVQYYQRQETVVKGLLAEMERQRDAVASHLDKLKEKFAEAKAAAVELYNNNKAMAGQIAKFQLDATRRIDERISAMAK